MAVYVRRGMERRRISALTKFGSAFKLLLRYADHIAAYPTVVF